MEVRAPNKKEKQFLGDTNVLDVTPASRLLVLRQALYVRILTSVQESTAGMEASAVRHSVRQTRANTRVQGVIQDTWAGQECLRHAQTSTNA